MSAACGPRLEIAFGPGSGQWTSRAVSFIQLFGPVLRAAAHFHARGSDGALMTDPTSTPLPSQRSLTLIEVAMVLAIAAVVIGGVMTLYLSTSNQRKITETTTLVVSAVQKISDLLQGKDMRELTGQVALAYGVLPKTYEAVDVEGYNLPITNARMTFGATDFTSGPNFGIIHVGPLDTDACISLGKLNLGEVVKYVVIDKAADFVGTSEADLAAHSVKDLSGDVTIVAVSGACDSKSFVNYYVTN